MAYSELMKDFSRVRAYLRDFYIYGFRHRNEYTLKSARGYDNERRRVESWLGDYMSFGQDSDGRRVFLSVDSRRIPENPLYRAFYAKSFTDKDIMLHFHLMDLLDPEEGTSLSDILFELEDRLNTFPQGEFPDESTVRAKLKEYIGLGLIRSEKQGKTVLYSLEADHPELSSWGEALDFYSETAPLGVIGSYLRRELNRRDSFFRFKHHYMLNALDSEILELALAAMNEGREAQVLIKDRWITVVPLKIYIGCQSGRQYILCRNSEEGQLIQIRADQIDSIRLGAAAQIPEGFDAELSDFQSHLWGVSTGERGGLERLEMTLLAEEGEEFIPERLRAEKRCGSVAQVDARHWKFSAEIYDALELLPWLRSFLGRITELKCSNPEVEARFWADYDAMQRIYLEET